MNKIQIYLMFLTIWTLCFAFVCRANATAHFYSEEESGSLIESAPRSSIQEENVTLSVVQTGSVNCSFGMEALSSCNGMNYNCSFGDDEEIDFDCEGQNGFLKKCFSLKTVCTMTALNLPLSLLFIPCPSADFNCLATKCWIASLYPLVTVSGVLGYNFLSSFPKIKENWGRK